MIKQRVKGYRKDIKNEGRAVLHFDGAVEPVNPGGVAVASYVVRTPKGELITKGAVEICRGAEATNNVAEWNGLIYGLKALQELEWSEQVEIYGDSKLVIEQLLGNYAVRKDHLIPLYEEAAALLSKWSWNAQHVPREQNVEADAIGKDYYVEHNVFGSK